MATLATVFLALLAGSSPDDAEVRKAVERSLPYLEKEGLAWIQKRDCLSCHTVTFMLWAHEEARIKGIGIDAKKLAEWNSWSMNESTAQRVRVKLSEANLEALKGESMPAEILAKLAPLAKKPAGKEAAFLKDLEKTLTPEEFEKHRASLLKQASREKSDGGGLDTMGQLLLAGVYGDANADFVASTRARILELQQSDGSWKPGGQQGGMNRSAIEGAELTTMWTLLALSEKTDEASEAAVEKAVAFVKSKTGKTNEWLALRLLVERRFGTVDGCKERLKELTGRQNADGGWAWIQGAASDAFATGQVLYALSRAGLGGDHEAIQRGRKLLIETQGADGSWAVPPISFTNPASKPDRLKRLEPIYNYWGSAWASIGLASTLPAKP